MPVVLHRLCYDCGEELTIIANNDGTYEGGYYLGDDDDYGQEIWVCEKCYDP